MDDIPSTVTSVKGNRGSSHGKTQVKSTTTSAARAIAQISARTAVGPGRWFQIQPYIYRPASTSGGISPAALSYVVVRSPHQTQRVV